MVKARVLDMADHMIEGLELIKQERAALLITAACAELEPTAPMDAELYDRMVKHGITPCSPRMPDKVTVTAPAPAAMQ